MTTLGGFLGLKSTAANSKRPAEPQAQNQVQNNVVELDEELFSPMATQIGEENEAIRNLLIDAEYKIGELDAIKDAFGKLVDPFNKTLRAFEEEKTKQLSLQTILNNTRVSYGKMRNELAAADKKATALESECAHLKEDLTSTQNTLRTVERAKAEQAVENAAHRTKNVDLERRLKQELKEREDTREENRRFGERLVAADKRIVALESDNESARQKVVVAERERSSIQSTLDQSHDENARISRRLIDAENTIGATQSRLRDIETTHAEVSAERSRLASALDQASERHRAEATSQYARFETLQTRATTTEKLLDEARQNLAARSDEIRGFERRLIEASLVRNALESKLGEIERANTERESQLKETEQARAALAERTAMLAKAVKAREIALKRAEETIVLMNDRIGQIEGVMQVARETAEEQIEELNAALQREKLERAMADGALETGRKDFNRILRELQALQARRGEANDYEPLPVPAHANAA